MPLEASRGVAASIKKKKLTFYNLSKLKYRINVENIFVGVPMTCHLATS